MPEDNGDLDDIGRLRTMAYVMERLDCSRSKILRLGKQGRLEIVKIDRSVRITDRSLQQLLREAVAESGNRR